MTMKTPTQVFSFTDSATVPGDRLDAQFADHALAITDTQAAVADVRRTDGALKNGIVTVDSLAPDTATALTATIAGQVSADSAAAAVSAANASASATAAANSATTATNAAAQAVAATNEITTNAGSALATIEAARLSAVSAQTATATNATNASNSANDAALAKAYAEDYADVAQAWAEYTPGPIPPNILAVMGITGEHWSARWWALQADYAATQAETAANGILNLGGFYLGAYSTPPTIDPFTQGAIKQGASYYDTALATLRIYNGGTWVSATVNYSAGSTPIQTNILVDVSWWVFDGVTTSFPLKDYGGIPITPGAASGQLVSLDGLLQNPATEYTISGSTITFTTAPVAGTTAWMVAGLTLSGNGLTDGDKGDITVSSAGTVWTLDAGVVTTTKMGGDVTASGKALLTAANAAAQRTALGLGTLSTKAQITLTTDVTGTLPIANGGTGATTAAAALTALGGAPLASPTFTGTPAAPTPAADTNTTQLATTAFFVGQASSTNPVANGTAAPGTSLKFARADHVHPSDTTKANLASPTFTGTPAAPTPAADTNTTQLATTAFVVGQAASTNPVANGTAAPGTSLKFARADHVHPTDTTRAPLASPTFTGTPAAPTPVTTDNGTTLATTAFVRAAITAYGGSGAGDMLKSVYDTNNDGIVDRAALADSVAWANVSGKPTFGTMSTQNASAVAITGGSITNLTTFDGVTVDGGTF